jgi:hypothetical protein
LRGFISEQKFTAITRITNNLTFFVYNEPVDLDLLTSQIRYQFHWSSVYWSQLIGQWQCNCVTTCTFRLNMVKAYALGRNAYSTKELTHHLYYHFIIRQLFLIFYYLHCITSQAFMCEITGLHNHPCVTLSCQYAKTMYLHLLPELTERLFDVAFFVYYTLPYIKVLQIDIVLRPQLTKRHSAFAIEHTPILPRH